MTSEAPKLANKRVLVIDDDEVIRNLLANYLEVAGVTQVDQAEDGQTGWDMLQQQKYDCIYLDWKLPRLGGLALFNRIRSQPELRAIPLTVISGFLQKNDFRLLQEFPCTDLMEKPFTKAKFDNKLETIIREADWYEQNVTLVESLLTAVDNDGKKALNVVKELLANAPNPVPLAMIAGRRLVMHEDLDIAIQIFEMVLEFDERCIVARSELGRTLHLKGRHLEALDALKKAHDLSPQSLERLCLMGEVELNLNEPEKAKQHFIEALEIDPDSVKARAGVVIATNMEEAVGDTYGTRVPKAFASALNSLGVGYIREGDFERGIEQYRAAMNFLYTDVDTARLAFNLGLGYMRWGKPAEALPWFEESQRLGGSHFTRSSGFVQQLKAAVGVDRAEDLNSKISAPASQTGEANQVPHDQDDQVEDDAATKQLPVEAEVDGDRGALGDELAEGDQSPINELEEFDEEEEESLAL